MASQDSAEPATRSSQDIERNHRDPDTSKNLHDFRNAMRGAIGGVARALLRIDDADECRRLLENALKASQRAARIASKFE